MGWILESASWKSKKICTLVDTWRLSGLSNKISNRWPITNKKWTWSTIADLNQIFHENKIICTSQARKLRKIWIFVNKIKLRRFWKQDTKKQKSSNSFQKCQISVKLFMSLALFTAIWREIVSETLNYILTENCKDNEISRTPTSVPGWVFPSELHLVASDCTIPWKIGKSKVNKTFNVLYFSFVKSQINIWKLNVLSACFKLRA